MIDDNLREASEALGRVLVAHCHAFQAFQADDKVVNNLKATLDISDSLREWYLAGIPALPIPWIVDEVEVFSPLDLIPRQGGYAFNTKTGARSRTWPTDWIAVGSIGGDVLVSCTSSSRDERILFSSHGQGEWTPIPCAPSLSVFLRALAKWTEAFCAESRGVDDVIRPVSDFSDRLERAVAEVVGTEYLPFWRCEPWC